MKILFNWIEFDDVENSFCSHFKNEYIKKVLVDIFNSQRWRFWICADVIDGGGWRATSVHGNASCRKSFAKRVNQVHSSCAVCIRESTSILIAVLCGIKNFQEMKISRQTYSRSPIGWAVHIQRLYNALLVHVHVHVQCYIKSKIHIDSPCLSQVYIT